MTATAVKTASKTATKSKAGAPRGPRRNWKPEFKNIMAQITDAPHGSKGQIYQDLAKSYGVSVPTIHNVVKKAQGAKSVKAAAPKTAPVKKAISQPSGAIPTFNLRSVHLDALSNDDLLTLRDMVAKEGQMRAESARAFAAHFSA